MFDVERFREQFPVLSEKVNGKDYYYFDSAATSLKPKVVAERIYQYYLREVSNIHRGSHYLGRLGTQNYEAVRAQAAQFVNAKSEQEIVFTKGVTESINLLAYSLGETLSSADTVCVSHAEHHSNIVPWILLRERRNINIQVVQFNEDGSISREELERVVGLKPKVLSLIMYSNVTGVRADIESVINAVKPLGTITIVDAAQAVLHESLDVQKLDCDFLTLSAHKMFGPFGVGILYGKKERLVQLAPFMGGGSMISQVQWEKLVLQDPPYKFEAGTPSIADVLGFGAALQFINEWGVTSWTKHTQSLVEYIEQEIAGIKRIRQIGPRIGEGQKADIVSFVYEGAHPSDVGEILDQMGIAIRAGHHCAQPLMASMGISGTVRVSLAPYNTMDDARFLIQALKKAGDIL